MKDYNQYMGGVDTFQQLYGLNRKSLKGWHSIFGGPVDMAALNTYVLYKEIHDEYLPLFDFRREVA